MALALALAGCGVAGPAGSPPASGPRPGEGRLVLYLNGPVSAPLQVEFELTSLDGLLDGDVRMPIRSAPMRINSLDVIGRQILLAETFLPQGRYRKVALGIARARARQEGKWADLSVPAEGFVLNVDFEVVAGRTTPLFMTWDVGQAIEGEAFFRPAFGLEGKRRELAALLAYVTNEGSDSVSVIDRALDQVVSVLAVGKAPRGITVTRDASQAFVVDAGASTLSIIDINTDRVMHRTNLEAGANASEVAITPDGRKLYVTNTMLNNVSVIDARSFQTLRTIPVGFSPRALAPVPIGGGMLVANGGSNSVSLIDTSRDAVVTTIPVDFQPSNMAVDPSGSQAFVPHLASPRLAVVSLSSQRTVRTLTVGMVAAALSESDGAVRRLFLARPAAGRVVLYDVTQGSEIESIPVGQDPRYLALDTEREKLYVVNRGSDTVTVIDRVSRRVRATIQVGKRPYAMAIVP
jgi:YVTN family beta-propeller protein